MAIKNLAKADALVRQLAENLKVRIAGTSSGFVDTVREARDSEGYPYLVLSDNGTETATNPVIFIRIKQIDAISKDIFGNDLKAYAPHLCELAYEYNNATATTTAKLYPSHLDLTKVMFEIAKLGVKVQVKELSGAVTETNVNSAAIALELDWLQWPTKGV